MSRPERMLKHERAYLMTKWSSLVHRGYEPYLVCACEIGQEWPGVFWDQIQASEKQDKHGFVWRIISRSPVDPNYLMMYALPRRQKR